MTYFSFAGGFKAGGFNSSAPAGAETFDQERSWNYELGLKGRALDNRLSFGAALFYTDWKDLQLIGGVIAELQKKHDFLFTLYGLVGEPLEAAMYTYSKLLSYGFQPEKRAYHQAALDFYNQLEGARMWHVPFMPPELHPKTLSMCDLDIGLAPLEDNEFNRGKSNIKFYEYASVGTVTLASDVLPYNSEVTYVAKNTHKDWYNKLEKLIVDTEFRKKELKKQQEWVKKNRNLEAIGLDWELACQKPSKWGLSVLNQSK
jgi:hypothetical protein